MFIPQHTRIYVAIDPVDMRKSHHGLSAIVRDNLNLDPLSGNLFLFINKRGNLLKLLFFDRTGMAILYKRLEAGTFQKPATHGEHKAEIDPAQLAMLLEGIDLRKGVRRKRYSRAKDIARHRKT